jgi:hypothetical protein
MSHDGSKLIPHKNYKQRIGPQIPSDVIEETVDSFLISLYSDCDMIAARWITKQINPSSNVEDNIYELCYMIFSQEMHLSVISGNVLFYLGIEILCIPIKHLCRNSQEYVNAMCENSTLFFSQRLSVSFGSTNYYNFKYNLKINKSRLRYFIFSKILSILVETNIANNNNVGAINIVKGIIKHIILRTKSDFVKSATTNEIQPAFRSTALGKDKSIQALTLILNISDDTSKLIKTLTSQSYLEIEYNKDGKEEE